MNNNININMKRDKTERLQPSRKGKGQKREGLQDTNSIVMELNEHRIKRRTGRGRALKSGRALAHKKQNEKAVGASCG